MTFKERSDYFKMICSKVKIIAHNVNVEGTVRNSYFRFNNEEELNVACKEFAHFPCVVHIGHNISFTHNGDALPKKKIANHLYFLAQTNKSLYPFENDAIEAAYEEAYRAMSHFISFMIDEAEDTGANCDGLFLFDMNTARAEQIGPYNESLYGWYITFYDVDKAKEFIYNSNNYYS